MDNTVVLHSYKIIFSKLFYVTKYIGNITISMGGKPRITYVRVDSLLMGHLSTKHP